MRKPLLKLPNPVPVTIPEEMDYDPLTYVYSCPFKRAGIMTFERTNDKNVEEDQVMEVEEDVNPNALTNNITVANAIDNAIKNVTTNDGNSNATNGNSQAERNLNATYNWQF